MKVIVASLQKTGTTSMFRALQVLGYNVHDCPDTFEYFGDEWIKYFETGYVPNFKAMYENVDAITDLPATPCFWELFEAFPDSKVILMEREEEALMKSLLTDLGEMWWRYYFLSYFSYHVNKFRRYVLGSYLRTYGTFSTKEVNQLRMGVRRHNFLVKSLIPAEQLLVFNVKQGWEPLCSFLQVPIPDQSFPKSNVHKGSDRCTFFARGTPKAQIAKMECLLSTTALVAGVTTLAVVALKHSGFNLMKIF